MKPKAIGIVAIAALAILLVAFGPAPKSSKGDAANTLHVTSLSNPDSIDPAISWTGLSWSMQVNVYNGLLAYKKASGVAGTEVVPDIAEALPEITDGGRTYSFKVRKGVMFGPPANREVKPSDIKYTFDRLALIPSQGVGFYSVVEGFDDFMESKKGTVSGIVADDDAGTVVFHLTRPDATFLYSLALPFSFVVPKGTPPEDLSLGNRTPATGPYMFSDYDPARHVILTRNPKFKQWTEDSPDGHVDKIEIDLKVSDDNAITRIMQGSADASLGAIPRSKLPFLQSSKEWMPYLHQHVQPATSYIWLNTQVAPFDNVKVRQAVNWAISRRAFVKLAGGAGEPSSTILPSALPGAPDVDPYPKQDMAKAKQLISESGITPGKVTIWCFAGGSTDTPQYLQAVMNQLGFEARTRCVDPSAYYNVVGVKKNNTQMGFANWSMDFPEGATFFYSNLYGANINPDHSSNYAWYTGSDSEIERIMKMTDLDERAAAWKALDTKMMTDDAPWVPMFHGVKRELIGKRVGDYVNHPLYDFLFMKATVDGSGTNNSKEHEGEVGYEDEGGDES